MGGSYDEGQNALWRLGILRISDALGTDYKLTALHFTGLFNPGTCKGAGYTLTSNAPYVATLGIMESTAHGGQLFGFTNSHDITNPGDSALVFRVILNPTTGDPTASFSVRTADAAYNN